MDHVAALDLDCPSGYNDADHMMDMLVVDTAVNDNDLDDDDNSDGNTLFIGSIILNTTTTKQRMIDGWDGETVAKNIDDEFGLSARGHRSDKSHTQIIVNTESSFNTTWWTQYTVLVHRSMKNSCSAIFTTLNLIKVRAIGLIYGLLWFQMPYTESTVFDRSSY